MTIKFKDGTSLDVLGGLGGPLGGDPTVNQINRIRIGAFELDAFICDNGSLGITAYKGSPEADDTPFVDIYPNFEQADTVCG